MTEWLVTYLVKYSEQWCADECRWLEHVERVTATDEISARRVIRKRLDGLPRLIRGRHISTTRIR